MEGRCFYVYINTNKTNKVLYAYEVCDDINWVIAREKQIKNLQRSKKIEMINKFNPKWEDLSSAF